MYTDRASALQNKAALDFLFAALDFLFPPSKVHCLLHFSFLPPKNLKGSVEEEGNLLICTCKSAKLLVSTRYPIYQLGYVAKWKSIPRPGP